MIYQTLEEAITGEEVNTRGELVVRLATRFPTWLGMPDDQLLELANKFRSERGHRYPDSPIANDPIDW